MNKQIKNLLIVMIIFSFIAVPYLKTEASEFNNSFVISQSQFENHNALSLIEIQSFLELKLSYLATFETLDKDRNLKKSSEIIYNAAQEYRINPKVILVMLQKEQSVIENSSPSSKQIDWSMGYGVCDDCSMNDPALLLFKGFGNQVDKATARLRWYLENPDAYKQAGVEYVIDGRKVTPVNQATAALYTYTPHIHGNYLFWKIWNRWFIQYYPNGSLLKSLETQKVYLIKFGEKRPFQNMSSLISRYDPSRILSVAESELDKYEQGASIEYANYSLLREPSGTIYLLVDDVLRHIDSYETFRTIGFNPEEIVQVMDGDLTGYMHGEAISITSAYPMGGLLQNNITGGVYFVQDGVKHALIAKEIMQLNYPNHPITAVTPEELDKYNTGATIKFNEGQLLKSPDDPRVFVVSEGTKKPVKDAYVFLKLGYEWNDIYTVSEKSLSNLPEGPLVDLTFKQ